MVTLSSVPTSRRLRNIHLVRDDGQFQVVSVANFLIISGAHMNTSFFCFVKVNFFLGVWSYIDT